MNLFNIGVDGQYRLAAFLAAVVGGAVTLPGFLEIPLIIVVAMLVGAMWAGIAGLLKVTRGVSEVISTIMLNSIADRGDRLPAAARPPRAPRRPTPTSCTPPILPKSGLVLQPSTGNPAAGPIDGFLVLAVLVGIAYWFMLVRTRFGFDLRAVGPVRVGRRGQRRQRQADGRHQHADLRRHRRPGRHARAARRDPHLRLRSFPTGLGFTGIAIALLGRNHPVGIAFGALLWAFLDRTSNWLDFNGYAKEIVGVIQGVIVLSVVIAYELVRRYGLGRQQRRSARNSPPLPAPPDRRRRLRHERHDSTRHSPQAERRRRQHGASSPPR